MFLKLFLNRFHMAFLRSILGAILVFGMVSWGGAGVPFAVLPLGALGWGLPVAVGLFVLLGLLPAFDVFDTCTHQNLHF